ncbi:VIT1/CCC1 family predicted Fe2+/Mn2+ transporter [Rhodoglobus vestalii]|uniref:VIT1/CCC1 family predicted Fe2+/Mn2+ transporter n=1 Tax=Rhodoglobus vestalii TaxID=193384 RepID=A0A8H2KA77_9MICO|nr:VIT1/CCC1 family protein [Rhodoglobus vestalii]TQO20516.1 VIT1/CCC1 family predicted Fe2+/Mn2+ transporter [Rhodoglobus vestalii]
MSPEPKTRDVRRWRRYLAAERAEAAIYRDLASRRTGEEREILLALAAAEKRHEDHWLRLLGDRTGRPLPTDPRTSLLGLLARRFGSVFVLALAQRAESRSPYLDDTDATDTMAADEAVHEEVVRALATRGRQRLSGTFRAAVFGANDGLVSNLALVLGMSAAGLPTAVVLLTGVAGLLAGALSMAAGEYVSVRSQLELENAAAHGPIPTDSVTNLDVDENELALVYRARGMSTREADVHAAEVLAGTPAQAVATAPAHNPIGSALGAAGSSFVFFASGAIIPVLPYLFGAEGLTAVFIAAGLVGVALLLTGSIVGLLSGASPLKRALRQLAIGYGAAAATYLLGLLFGVSVG